MVKKIKAKKKISISAFFPCYNDAGTIASMVELATLTLKKLAGDFEVIVVDDGSNDWSRNNLNDNVDIVQGYKIERHDPWYRILIGNVYNFGVKLAFGIKIKDVDCDFRLI